MDTPITPGLHDIGDHKILVIGDNSTSFDIAKLRGAILADPVGLELYGGMTEEDLHANLAKVMQTPYLGSGIILSDQRVEAKMSLSAMQEMFDKIPQKVADDAFIFDSAAPTPPGYGKPNRRKTMSQAQRRAMRRRVKASKKRNRRQ